MLLENKIIELLGKSFNECTSMNIIFCKCDYCGEEFSKKKKDYIKQKKGIIKKDCCSNIECMKIKRKESSIARYEVENVFQLEGIKEKIKETCLEKYGVESYTQTDEYNEKTKDTCIKKYGVEHHLKSKVVRNKSTKTNLDRYGVEHYAQSSMVRDKYKKTCLKLYGVENYAQTKEYQEKFKKTSLERYGVDHPWKDIKIKNKAMRTMIKKYGTSFPHSTYGKTQRDIKDWLSSIGYEFDSNFEILGGKEIDLYNQDKKIGIEYCGLYWHNEASPEPRFRNYHYEKYKIGSDRDIRLITIFEDEWLHREIQCKNYIKSILGICSEKIYARKCSVEQIEKHIFFDFCNKNHIQGRCHSIIIAFGLYFQGRLIGVMSLSRHHRDNNKITLSRLCFSDGVQVIGGANKLFTKCKVWCNVNNVKEIISWSDNRWSQGKIYEIMGFLLDEEMSPDYSYVNVKSRGMRISKQSCKKKNIGCPKNKTEKEYMLEMGYARIWDCGKKRWIFKF